MDSKNPIIAKQKILTFLLLCETVGHRFCLRFDIKH